MWVLKRRILRYAYANDKLPANLSELTAMQGFDNEIVTDGAALSMPSVTTVSSP